MTFSLNSAPRALVKYNNQSVSAITEVGSGAGLQDAMVLIKTITADGSGTTVTFDSDIDSTYPIYVFKFINVHPSNDGVGLSVNFRDGSTAYDATKTTTFFYAEHREDDASTAFALSTGDSLEQSTSAQKMAGNIGSANDEVGSGELWLFDPSSTTFVKNFFGKANECQAGDSRSANAFYAGYCNVTAAIDGVQFSISAGNIDAGTFKMYGIKDS